MIVKVSIALIVTLISFSPALASQMERCSYKTEHDGKVSETIEPASPIDGSNQKRFADIARKEQEGLEGWKGYHMFDVNCAPLNDKEPVFHMFVQTENGQVSLAHGLTEDACFYTLARLNPVPICNNCMHIVQGSDFKKGECFK